MSCDSCRRTWQLKPARMAVHMDHWDLPQTEFLLLFDCLLELAQPSLEDLKWIFKRGMCWDMWKMVQSYFWVCTHAHYCIISIDSAITHHLHFFLDLRTIFSRFFPFSKIFQKHEKVICWPNQSKLYSILPLNQLNSTLFNRNFTYIVRKSIYIDKGAAIFRDFMISWCPPMGYGPSNRYGIWDMGEFGPFGREPTRWTWESMGYRSLWVITGMD